MQAMPHRTYRIMTWNVHHCVGMDGRHDPRRVADVIREFSPDIVALQELETNHDRSDRIHQPALLSDLLEMEHHYHPARIRDGAGFGNAVFTRMPMRAVQAGILPSIRYPRLQSRGALWASINIEGHFLQIINTHFGLMNRERVLQAEALCSTRWLGHDDCRIRPRIVCGDFNATPISRTYRTMCGSLRDAQHLAGDPSVRTWPSVLPLVRYDHIFSCPGVDVRSVEVPRDKRTRLSSDHLPVIMDFRLQS